MKKWFRSLRKAAQTTVVIGVITALLAIGAIAAWLVTKEATGTGQIFATFYFDDALITESVPAGMGDGAIANVSTVIGNPNSSDMWITEVTLISTNEDVVSLTPPFSLTAVEATDPAEQLYAPQLIPPTESRRIWGRWYAQVDASVGNVPLVMAVTVTDVDPAP